MVNKSINVRFSFNMISFHRIYCTRRKKGASWNHTGAPVVATSGQQNESTKPCDTFALLLAVNVIVPACVDLYCSYKFLL